MPCHGLHERMVDPISIIKAFGLAVESYFSLHGLIRLLSLVCNIGQHEQVVRARSASLFHEACLH